MKKIFKAKRNSLKIKIRFNPFFYKEDIVGYIYFKKANQEEVILNISNGELNYFGFKNQEELKKTFLKIKEIKEASKKFIEEAKEIFIKYIVNTILNLI